MSNHIQTPNSLTFLLLSGYSSSALNSEKNVFNDYDDDVPRPTVTEFSHKTTRLARVCLFGQMRSLPNEGKNIMSEKAVFINPHSNSQAFNNDCSDSIYTYRRSVFLTTQNALSTWYVKTKYACLDLSNTTISSFQTLAVQVKIMELKG